jgi:sugar/nucleoside kinase (ribokinase family)
MPTPVRAQADHAALRRGVAVVGSTTIDRNVIDGVTHLKIGGVTTYAGLTYRRHGLPTWVVTNVAPSDASILHRLALEGIRVSTGPTEHTTRFVNRVQAGRRDQEVPSMAAPVGLTQLTAASDRVDLIHLGPLHPADIDAQVFVRLGDSRSLIALDVQGLLRKTSVGRIEPAVSKHLPAALTAAGIVKSDADELRLILSAFESRVEDIMGRCAIAEWVVTSGFHGGCVFSRGQAPYRYSAEPSPPVVDPTGAGDVFFAAYTVARFRERQPVAAAARYAATLAAEHVAGRYLADLRIAPSSAAGPDA